MRYVIFARAVFPLPTSWKAPVPGSGASASSGIDTGDVQSIVTAALLTRLATSLPPECEGIGAKPPSGAQDRGRAGSEKPPIGFQAAVAFVAKPTRSQPFHGKSLSFTVRRKIAELNPDWESWAMFSTPCENSALN